MHPSPEPVELRSEEVQEILARTPRWMVRWGSTVVLAIVLGLISFAWLIQYPDIITGSAVLTTLHEPAYVYTRSFGNIRRLHVRENDLVHEGQLLAEITSPVDQEQIAVLQQRLQAVRAFLREPAVPLTMPEGTFGEVQGSYNLLVEHVSNLNQLYTPYYTQIDRQMIDNIAHYAQLADIYQAKLIISRRELNNARLRYAANQQLLEGKAIARLDMLEQESAYNQKRSEEANIRQALVQNELMQAEQRRQLAELRFNQSEAIRKLRAGIASEMRTLGAYVQTWQQNNSVVAPTTGRVIFAEKFSEGFYAKANQPLLVVVPQDERILAKVKVPAARYGKVQVGQRVRLTLDNYPFQEYGFLFGQVRSKGYVPVAKRYELLVDLPRGLTTSYGQLIEYKPNMPATADVIVENQRLLEKLFYSFRQLLRR